MRNLYIKQNEREECKRALYTKKNITLYSYKQFCGSRKNT